MRHHTAFALTIAGRAGLDQIGVLRGVLERSHALRGAGAVTPDRWACASDALTACTVAHARGESSALDPDARAAFEQVLAIHDAQLAAVPVHRYLAALERLLSVDDA
ncbi:hypothetical protein [Burkholderia cepacia]|uniref:hypothetical protein n=1 Tax=Burkholderia cepacia TaxID=292 RepID=UPI002ABDF514|nr:hypothetical protein [Burkholderia cepacia]